MGTWADRHMGDSGLWALGAGAGRWADRHMGTWVSGIPFGSFFKTRICTELFTEFHGGFLLHSRYGFSY